MPPISFCGLTLGHRSVRPPETRTNEASRLSSEHEVNTVAAQLSKMYADAIEKNSGTPPTPEMLPRTVFHQDRNNPKRGTVHMLDPEAGSSNELCRLKTSRSREMDAIRIMAERYAELAERSGLIERNPDREAPPKAIYANNRSILERLPDDVLLPILEAIPNGEKHINGLSHASRNLYQRTWPLTQAKVKASSLMDAANRIPDLPDPESKLEAIKTILIKIKDPRITLRGNNLSDVITAVTGQLNQVSEAHRAETFTLVADTVKEIATDDLSLSLSVSALRQGVSQLSTREERLSAFMRLAELTSEIGREKIRALTVSDLFESLHHLLPDSLNVSPTDMTAYFSGMNKMLEITKEIDDDLSKARLTQGMAKATEFFYLLTHSDETKAHLTTFMEQAFSMAETLRHDAHKTLAVKNLGTDIFKGMDGFDKNLYFERLASIADRIDNEANKADAIWGLQKSLWPMSTDGRAMQFERVVEMIEGMHDEAAKAQAIGNLSPLLSSARWARAASHEGPSNERRIPQDFERLAGMIEGMGNDSEKAKSIHHLQQILPSMEDESDRSIVYERLAGLIRTIEDDAVKSRMGSDLKASYLKIRANAANWGYLEPATIKDILSEANDKTLPLQEQDFDSLIVLLAQKIGGAPKYERKEGVELIAEAFKNVKDEDAKATVLTELTSVIRTLFPNPETFSFHTFDSDYGITPEEIHLSLDLDLVKTLDTFKSSKAKARAIAGMASLINCHQSIVDLNEKDFLKHLVEKTHELESDEDKAIPLHQLCHTLGYDINDNTFALDLFAEAIDKIKQPKERSGLIVTFAERSEGVFFYSQEEKENRFTRLAELVEKSEDTEKPYLIEKFTEQLSKLDDYEHKTKVDRFNRLVEVAVNIKREQTKSDAVLALGKGVRQLSIPDRGPAIQRLGGILLDMQDRALASRVLQAISSEDTA